MEGESGQGFKGVCMEWGMRLLWKFLSPIGHHLGYLDPSLKCPQSLKIFQGEWIKFGLHCSQVTNSAGNHNLSWDQRWATMSYDSWWTCYDNWRVNVTFILSSNNTAVKKFLLPLKGCRLRDLTSMTVSQYLNSSLGFSKGSHTVEPHGPAWDLVAVARSTGLALNEMRANREHISLWPRHSMSAPSGGHDIQCTLLIEKHSYRL